MPMRDAGLVGEEEHQIAGIVEPPDCLGGVRHPADLVRRADMADVMIDDAVAVEEGGGLLQGRCSAHGLAASRSTRRVMSATSDAETSRMQPWSFMVPTVR